MRSGGISLTEPTIVVLPTPKPPAISSLAAVTGSTVRGADSEVADAIEYRLEDSGVLASADIGIGSR